MNELQPGTVFTFDYPFIRVPVDDFDDDGNAVQALRWRPGCDFDYHADYIDAVAHGVGQQILTVVSTHKPGKYGRRVFYTRQWKDPAGNLFGNNRLRIKGIAAFTVLTRGYGYDFTVIEQVAA